VTSPLGSVPDAIIVGGGVIGLSAAWLAARAGMRVSVVDPAPGRGAAWVAAGMLAPAGEAAYGEEALTRLHLAAAARWPSFAADLEEAAQDQVCYRACGTVAVAIDASDRTALEDVLEFKRSLGLRADPLSASECRRLVPALAPGIRGGAVFPDDHQVDNRRLVTALIEACRRSGVEMVSEEASALRRTPTGGVDGVELRDHRFLPAGAVVLAMGWRTRTIGGVPPEVLPPVRPVKGHILRLRGDPAEPLLERTVRALVHGRSCYLVPRLDGSLVVGATVEERGSDERLQAGAVHALLDDARQAVPGLDELELEECATGLRPGSPDNAPFVGWTSLERLAVATGHYRNGVLLAPVTADGVVALLAGADVAPVLAPFSPDRCL